MGFSKLPLTFKKTLRAIESRAVLPRISICSPRHNMSTVERTNARDGNLNTLVMPAVDTVEERFPNKPNYLDQDTESSDDASSGNSSADEDEQSWISWFCSLKGNEFFSEVDRRSAFSLSHGQRRCQCSSYDFL